MTGYRKNTWLAVAALALGLVAFPVSYSEAQSAQMTLSAYECEQLGYLVLENMSTKQQELARQCDMVEASHDWEQFYGHLDEGEMLAGVVYE
ncbi:hypothetical protein [Neisseria animalis]|uniref:Uncharacterized protein n=1 Tax=Neisseria animalis TaxID=492 RepID=A0A5P3MPX5_NEIAN|nr:hypothetical protein [Neisseria animalis]QEY23594.1 hypothetical protein D0T90_03010 [Neisseria animalis]ROW32739.1 hypothetical protein CGZ60_02630 [Neisseria animalis]VEE09296.1 putative secreted protein [Neisseria animalis]